MNQKIQSLIDGGFISIEDVLEYAQQYNDRMLAATLDEYDEYYENEYNNNAPEEEKVEDPEYIIASTSYSMEETYVFEADADGQIKDFAELGGISKRNGDHNWMNYYGAVDNTFGENKYQFVGRIPTIDKIAHFLFKRI